MKAALGVLFVVVGASVVSGLDRSLETWLVTVSPPWLIDLTTRL